jgi:F0F1-type ATP synthase membrane subunit b/b'
MSAAVVPFPVRFRGYDRDAVDQEVYELRVALDYAKAERDRAVARVLVLESGEQPSSHASATVQWLIDTAEQDAQQIRADAEQSAAEYTRRAEALLSHRVELIEQAQHEADACRAEAAEEARTIVHDALEKANTLLRGLRESEASLRETFDSGALSHRMPPPRRSAEEAQQPFVPGMVDGYPQQDTAAAPVVDVPASVPAGVPASVPANVPADVSADVADGPVTAPVPTQSVAPQYGYDSTARHAVPSPSPSDDQQRMQGDLAGDFRQS